MEVYGKTKTWLRSHTNMALTCEFNRPFNCYGSQVVDECPIRKLTLCLN